MPMMDGIFCRDDDYGDWDDDSVSDNAESSEDDIDILLHGTPEQKRKLAGRCSGSDHNRQADENSSSSEDDFEKEMNKELAVTVTALEARNKQLRLASIQSSEQAGGSGGESGLKTPSQITEQHCSDEVYFDSDEEEMIEGEKKRRVPMITNDDLLYDPNMDDDDQRWVDSQRQRYQPSKGQAIAGAPRQTKRKGLPNSDAVLDCPACMTTLCLDCQRHDIYKNQYRAMFVSHCKVDFNEVLKYPKGKPNKKLKKKTRFNIDPGSGEQEGQMDGGSLGEASNIAAQSVETASGPGQPEDNEDYHPVRCTECNTVVAVYDREEIYHFFNVLSSYS